MPKYKSTEKKSQHQLTTGKTETKPEKKRIKKRNKKGEPQRPVSEKYKQTENKQRSKMSQSHGSRLLQN